MGSDGRILYIGCTSNPVRRLAEHIARGIVPRDVTLLQIAWYRQEWKALNAERDRIQSRRPPLNVMNNKLPEAEARAIWFSDPSASPCDLLARMPGWSKWSAYYSLGSRYKIDQLKPFVEGNVRW